MTCVKAVVRGDDVVNVGIDARGARRIRGAAWEAIEQGNDDLSTEICQTFERSDADLLDEKLREGLATFIDECVREWDEGSVEELFDTLSSRFAARGISLEVERKRGETSDVARREGARDRPSSKSRPETARESSRRRKAVILIAILGFLSVVGFGLWRFHVAATERRMASAIDWASHITKLADSDPARARALTDPTIDVNTGTSTWVSSLEPSSRHDAVLPEPSPSTMEVIRNKAAPRKLVSLPHARWLDVRSGTVVVAHEIGDMTDEDFEFALVRVSASSGETSQVIGGLERPSWIRFESDSSIMIRSRESVSRVSLAGGDLSVVTGQVSAFTWDTEFYYVASSVTVVGRSQAADGSISSIPRADGAATDLYSSLPPMKAIGVSGEKLFFIGREPASPREGRLSYAKGYLARASTSGEDEIEWTFFKTHRPRSLAVSDEAIFVLTEGTLEGHLNDGQVLRIPAEGGEWHVLAAGQPMSGELVRGGDWLCWATLDTLDYSVRCVSTSGGPVMEVGWGQGQARGVAIDGSRVYWSEGLAQSTIMVADIPIASADR